MITEVTIRNFKCFKKLTVPQLGRITLIGGRNNVGKTALLEALFLFFDRTRPDMILRQYAWRGIEGVASEPEAMWAPVFRNDDMNGEIIISATIDDKSEQAKFRYNRNFIRPALPNAAQSEAVISTVTSEEGQIPTDQKPFSISALDIEYSGEDDSRQTSHLFIDAQGQPVLHIDQMNIKSYPACFLAAKKHVSSMETANEFSKLAKEGREGEVVEFLRIIEPRLKALKVITEGPSSSVHGQLEGSPRAHDIHLIGEGMEKLLNLISKTVSSRYDCIFLDEIENGLHYAALPRIWEAVGKALRKYDCQLITTTHSYECIQAAHEGLAEISEDFKYIRLHRKGEDISAKISNYDMIGTAIKTNLEVR